MYIRRPPSTSTHNAAGSCQSKSLAFLHKPQRVSQAKPAYADDSLRRNTDLNRGSICVVDDQEADDYFSRQLQQLQQHQEQEYQQPGPAASSDSSSSALKPDDPSWDVASPLRVNPYFPLERDESQEHFLNSENGAPPLVRKKSGEVVRSNLKLAQRSRSLPATPSGREPDKRVGFAAQFCPQRSKSVHFDRRDVVSYKYFRQEDSPLDVAAQDVLEGPLDDTNQKQLSMSDASESLTGPNGEPLDLTMTMSNLRLEKKASNGFGLRRSNRYQKLKANAPGIRNGLKGNNQTRITQPGLHNENFPTLNVGDRTSLKLNIFLNIAHNSQCFLQELSLVSDQHYLIGHILVKNIFFDKKVVVRYTRDRWRTTNEVECVWVSSGNDDLPGRGMDRFKLVIDLATLTNDTNWGGPARGSPVKKANDATDEYASINLEFCIQYTTRCSEQRLEFWDNNGGRNYVVEVVTPKPRMGFTDPFSGG
ncbi:LANO_0B03708g1_1 [Lachancea nothofagi CBS 11611]|uniref:LANO_0B03708g1_1 n=1 Tax=Lachancea nothofagi CBS 11611 TaxID=1266666 RepID=A0A1G4IXK0_9SACH|nr:LANO_0B03708g1_1 [Lachancea nothofagi CBS 11611]